MKHIGIVLTVIITLGMTACFPQRQSASSSSAPAKTDIDADCTLVYSEGTVTMDGKVVEIGAKIADGALLKTDANGVAEIVFNQKNIVKMGPNTLMRLEVATLKRVVRLERGTFTAVLRKLDKLGGGSLEVKTPTAIAGVRGTSFFARFDPVQKEAYFCTCNGTLNLSLSDGSGELVKTANHHLTTIFSGENGSVSVIAPPPGFDFGHTDKDLENLAARIGETMDWTKVE